MCFAEFLYINNPNPMTLIHSPPSPPPKKKKKSHLTPSLFPNIHFSHHQIPNRCSCIYEHVVHACNYQHLHTTHFIGRFLFFVNQISVNLLSSTPGNFNNCPNGFRHHMTGVVVLEVSLAFGSSKSLDISFLFFWEHEVQEAWIHKLIGFK